MPAQVLLTPEIRAQLLENGRKTAAGEEIDPPPVVMIMIPGTSIVWLLTELDPEDEDIAFGLCDLNAGFPEIGSVRVSEIEETEIAGVPKAVVANVTLDRPLSYYTDQANAEQSTMTALRKLNIV